MVGRQTRLVVGGVREGRRFQRWHLERDGRGTPLKMAAIPPFHDFIQVQVSTNVQAPASGRKAQQVRQPTPGGSSHL